MADPATTEEVVTEPVVTEEAETEVATEEVVIEDPVTEVEVEEEEESPEEVLEMSDEDFEKAAGDIEDAEHQANIAEAEAEAASEEATTEEVVTEPVTEPAKEAVEDSAKPAKAEAPTTETVAEKPAIEDKAKPGSLVDPLGVTDDVAVSVYKEVFAPFRANGKTIQVRNADEARRLMQMGAGYTKTMMEMKPHIARAKTLENNGIKTADDLNYLIELKNGNPAAIKKLVRDTGIDPFDITVDDASKAADAKYRPKDYSASETQVNFEATLAEVGSLPGGTELLQSVYKDWDDASQTQVYNDPNTLRVLTGHKEQGIYDQVQAQVDHERMLGNLTGVPFLEAYTMVAQAMDAKGLFGNVADPAVPATENVTETKSTPAPVVAEPEVLDRKVAAPKPAANTARAKALAPVKAAAPGKALPANPLNMSDADFEKIEGLADIIG